MTIDEAAKKVLEKFVEVSSGLSENEYLELCEYLEVEMEMRIDAVRTDIARKYQEDE